MAVAAALVARKGAGDKGAVAQQAVVVATRAAMDSLEVMVAAMEDSAVPQGRHRKIGLDLSTHRSLR